MALYGVRLRIVWIDPATGAEHRWNADFGSIEAPDNESAAAIAASLYHAPGAIEGSSVVSWEGL